MSVTTVGIEVYTIHLWLDGRTYLREFYVCILVYYIYKTKIDEEEIV